MPNPRDENRDLITFEVLYERMVSDICEATGVSREMLNGTSPSGSVAEATSDQRTERGEV
jgi:hypothetical protein